MGTDLQTIPLELFCRVIAQPQKYQLRVSFWIARRFQKKQMHVPPHKLSILKDISHEPYDPAQLAKIMAAKWL